MKRIVIGLIAAVVLVAVAGGAFFGGTQYEKSYLTKNPQALFQQMAGTQGQDGQFRRFSGTPPASGTGATVTRNGGGSVGTIQSIDGNKLVISTESGNLTVLTSDTTLIQKFDSVGVDKLQVGEQVTVSGSKNADGTITARSIRSMIGFGFEQATDNGTPQPPQP